MGKGVLRMAENASTHSPQVSPPVSDLSRKSMSAKETRQELQQVIEGSNQVLARANTVLTLFPDTFIIDRAKITITKRSFFRTADIMSIRIEDVLNVGCTVGPFFGNLTLTSRVMNIDQTSVSGRFWRQDAKRLKRIAQGYVIALQRNIDCSALGTKELAQMLEKLGADNHQPVAGSDT
jgi:hypothetical protein